MKAFRPSIVPVVTPITLISALLFLAPDVFGEAPDPDFVEVRDNTEENSPDEQEEEKESEQAPAKGPGLFEVDEDAAVRALERSLIQIDALLLSAGHVEMGFDTSYGYDANSRAVLLELTDPDTNEITTTIGRFEQESRSYDFSLDLRIGLPFDSQLDLLVPFSSRTVNLSTGFAGDQVDATQMTGTGRDDFQVSVLKTLAHEKGRRPDIIARLTFDSDAGREQDDGVPISSGTQEYTLGLTGTKRQDPLVFTLGLSHTIAKKIENFEPGSQSQFSIGMVLASSPYTSIKLSFNQVVVEEATQDGVAILGSGVSLGSLTIGASSVISRSVFLSADLAMGLTDAASDYRFSIGLSKRFDWSR